MNFYDVLAAEKWDGGIPTINFFDLLFAQSISGEQWQVYEGTLPATLYANGSDLRQYQVWGNTGGVGDKTENLLNYREINYTHVWNSSGQLIPSTSDTGWLYASPMIAVIAGKTYIRTYNLSPLGNVLYIYDAQKNFISRETPGVGVPFTIANSAAYISYNIEVNENYKASAYMLTEGTTAPASYVPFGYEVDMVSRTRNSLPSAAEQTITNNGVTATCDGKGKYSFTGTASGQVSITFTLPYAYIIPTSKGGGGNGTFSIFNTKSWGGSANNINLLYNSQYIDTWNFATVNRNAISYSAMAEKTINAIRFNFAANTNTNFSCSPMFTNDSYGLPNAYEPYSNTTTPIYIGDEPLDKDEYIDYQAGKIYRMIDSTLTPTDPPVTLPALPTVEGTTIVDYAGQSVAPEKVYFEYQGGKQP